MADAEKTAAIVEALKERHQNEIWAVELGLGNLVNGVRRCDFWTLYPQASKSYLARAYEIKVSKPDFRRDTALKQRMARLYADEFWYVTPPGLVAKEDIPDWAGWQTWSADDGWRVPVSAPRRDKDAPSWDLVVSIMRYSGDIRRDVDLRVRQMQGEIEHLKWRLGQRDG